MKKIKEKRFLSIFKMMLNAERCSVLPDSTVAHIVFLRDVWIRILRAAVANKQVPKKVKKCSLLRATASPVAWTSSMEA